MENNSETSTEGFSLSLKKGPFQNNGASQWYAKLGLGSPAQDLKFSFDTGSNFIWVTSSLCSVDGCKHSGGERFNIENSNTFKNIELIPTPSNPTPHVVDFGPWGSMEVNAGNDFFSLFPKNKCYKIEIQSDFYTAKSYDGVQFEELDWDGGIGIPALEIVPESNSSTPALLRYRSSNHHTLPTPPSFHFFKTLMEKGYVSREQPYVGFTTDPENGNGTVDFGLLDESYKDSLEYLFLPWDKYSIDEVSYLWSTKLYSLSINDTQLLSSNEHDTAFFSLDTGSSQFKGDANAMKTAFQQAESFGGNLEIVVGQTESGENGKIIVPPEVYKKKIEAGQDQGDIVPQFAPLEGVDNLALVGSVIMDQLYTVYEYSVVDSGSDIKLIPEGMWIFNKPGGANLIKTKQSTPAALFNNYRSEITKCQ